MTIHVGLIGGGKQSQVHMRAQPGRLPESKLQAIYGTNTSKVSVLCQETRRETISRLDAFLQHRPMDLSLSEAPSGFTRHSRLIAAARRGLHILTEKPIEITTKRADALIEAAECYGVKLGSRFRTA